MAEVRMEEHIGDRLPPMERRCTPVMESGDIVQIKTVPLEDSGKEEDCKIGYQQIARHCW